MRAHQLGVLLLAGSLFSLLHSCQSSSMTIKGHPQITTAAAGQTATGEGVQSFTMRNKNGLVARVSTLGATLTHLYLPDADGAFTDVVLGFDDVAGYESDGNQYFGCTAGRVANRIAKGQFEIDGESYQLATNNDPNHLHGGVRGFDKVLWQGREQDGSIVFEYKSPDGDEGYPGVIEARVSYTLTDDDELRIDYRAESSQATPLNLTNHSYFNLGGEGSPTVLDHELRIVAANYTPVDETLIPTGEIAPVAGTALDFREAHVIGERIAAVSEAATIGYDHNFVLDSKGGDLALAAVLKDPGSGRQMEIWTTKPGIQLYSGNFLMDQIGKEGKKYAHRSALCLETQFFPDSINHPAFPNCVLKPGDVYEHTTIHRFSAQ